MAGKCPGVYYVRLQRDGWILKDQLTAGLGSAFVVFEKALPRGWVLRKYAHADVGAPPGKGCYWDEHELEHPKLDCRFPKPNWEWAELDGKTVVWAEEGQLMRAPLERDGLGDPRILFDFNDMKFERRTAP